MELIKKGNRILAALLLILLLICTFFSVFPYLSEDTGETKKVGLTTSIEQTARMTNDRLYDTIVEEVVETLDMDGGEATPESLAGAQLVFYVLDYFDLEVQNGGLCQFYVNSSKKAAPYVSKALAEVGAGEYQELFDRFNETYGIDTEDLSSFAIQKLEEFDRQQARYPFEEFDQAYKELNERCPLNELLIRYAREHLEDFYL